jgi:hypothetical protein
MQRSPSIHPVSKGLEPAINGLGTQLKKGAMPMYRTPQLKSLNAEASALIQNKISGHIDNGGTEFTKPQLSPSLESE